MKQSRGTAVFLLIIMVIGMPFGFFWASRKSSEKEKAYLERGIWVDGTVTGVTYGGKHQEAELTYTDQNGAQITARATLNRKVVLGERAGGYVLPEDPYEVYYPGTPLLKIVFYVLFWGIWAASLLGVVMFFRGEQEHKLLKRSGLPVKAELISISHIEDSTFGRFRFTAQSGREYVKELPISHGTPFPGDSYDVLYYEKKPGKCAAELIDFKLV